MNTNLFPNKEEQILAVLWELQSTGGGELSALMASILDKAFKGEL